MNRYNIFENVLFLNETEIDPVQYLTSVNEYCDAIQTNEIITEGFKDFVSTIIAKIKEMIKKFTEAVKKFFKGIKDKFKKEKTKETIDFVKTHNKELEEKLVEYFEDVDRLTKVLVIDGYKYCDYIQLINLETKVADNIIETTHNLKMYLDTKKFITDEDVDISIKDLDENTRQKIAILEEKEVFRLSILNIAANAELIYKSIDDRERVMNGCINDLHKTINYIEIFMRKRAVNDSLSYRDRENEKIFGKKAETSNDIERFFRQTLITINKEINKRIRYCNQLLMYEKKCFDFYNNLCIKFKTKIS